MAYRWLIGALLAGIFILQSYSLAHSAQYIEAGHDHDGVSCTLTLSSTEDIGVLPTPPAAAPRHAAITAPEHDYKGTGFIVKPVQSFCNPRAPPT